MFKSTGLKKVLIVPRLKNVIIISLALSARAENNADKWWNVPKESFAFNFEAEKGTGERKMIPRNGDLVKKKNALGHGLGELGG